MASDTPAHLAVHGTAAGRSEETNNPVRIVYVINSLRTGGAERHLVRLIGGMQQTNRWTASVYCLSREGPFIRSLEDLGISVVGSSAPWSGTPRRLLGALADLWLYLRREEPAIVHCYLPPAIALGPVAARLARVPIVVSSRRIVHTYRGRRLVLYRAVTAISDRFSDRVIAVCEAARDQAIREGTPAAKVVTVRNGVLPFPRESRDSARFIGSPRFGSVGELHARKGFLYLLSAAPFVLQALPSARFILVGDGPERDTLEKLAIELGIRDHVDFAGSSDKVVDYLRSFDVFVLPSVSEGTPNAMLEAMAAGLPIVGTTVGGVPEIVTTGVNGVLVEPQAPAALAEALIELGTNEERRSAYGLASTEIVRTRFDPNREIDSTMEIYNALLNLD